MNCSNQRMTGMPDYIPQNGRVPMPAWQMPVENTMPGWQQSMMQPAVMQPPVMQPPVMQPAMPSMMQPPMSFEMQMESGRFPLAMSYVPMQSFSQPSPLEEGFRRGTIFRELDLPFERGRCR